MSKNEKSIDDLKVVSDVGATNGHSPATQLSIPHDQIQAKLKHFEAEYQKGQQLIANTQAQLLRLEGAILALREQSDLASLIAGN
ncbi:MAG: hypothetical protein AAB091_02360 [Elusimicrobiota bacterium]